MKPDPRPSRTGATTGATVAARARRDTLPAQRPVGADLERIRRRLSGSTFAPLEPSARLFDDVGEAT